MFQPVLPLGGLPGWTLLNRTLPTQTEAFNASPEIVRDTDYFEANIASVASAGDLVSDRRLLRVALGAFGLLDDINSRALVQRVLESDTAKPGSLANRLSDPRYGDLAEAFGFGNTTLGPRNGDPGFAERITDQFRTRSFEAAVGQQDVSLRLAMNATRQLAEMANDRVTDDTAWFRVLGTPPLRTVFESALGLPAGFGQLDIERQLDEIKSRASRRLDIEAFRDFGEEAKRDELVQAYLLREQVNIVSSLSPQTIALSLLQN